MTNQMIIRHEIEMKKKERAASQAAVSVFSRSMIDKGAGRGGVLISIIQPEFWKIMSGGGDETVNSKPVSPEHWRKVLTLKFLDTTPAESNVGLFEEQHVDLVWDFVKDVRHDEAISVHCTAGVSRSVGVGLVLSEVLERRLIVETGVGTQYANPHVVALMRRRMWNEQLNNVINTMKSMGNI